MVTRMVIGSRAVSRRLWRPVVARLVGAVRGEEGMSTAEYAIAPIMHPQ